MTDSVNEQDNLDEDTNIQDELDETYSLEETDVNCGDLRVARANVPEDSDEDKVPYMELKEEFSIEPEIIAYHVKGECSCNSEEDPLEKDRPWTEKALLEYLLIEKNFTYIRAARAFGCHQQTVNNWAGEERFDIMIIDSSERVSSPQVTNTHRIGVQRSEELTKEERLRVLYNSLQDDED